MYLIWLRKMSWEKPVCSLGLYLAMSKLEGRIKFRWGRAEPEGQSDASGQAEQWGERLGAGEEAWFCKEQSNPPPTSPSPAAQSDL